MDFGLLDDDQRRAILLSRVYERVRQQRGQSGYRLFKILDESTLKNPTFKTFVTVTKWLTTHGWSPTSLEVHWQGYVQFVFEKFGANYPQPGQLKNDMLLKQYMLSIPEMTLSKPTRDLASVYRTVLRRDICEVERLLSILGVQSKSSTIR